MLTIKLADINISIDYNCDQLSSFFKDYLNNEKADFIVTINDDDINYEKNKSEYNHKDIEYIKLAIYRKIAEQLPKYDACLLHGSALYINNNATLLAGKSGIGKSTHARLLSEYYNAQTINDDKPIVRIIDNVPYVYGTPYDGKHHLSQNISKPLSNIIYINQDINNNINILDKDTSFNRLMIQTYRPIDIDSLKSTIQLVNMINKYTNSYILNCDISKQAAKTSYDIICK